MGKKTKVGKSRRDKFYKLSKEIGYRSRAAFKLIQLNQKYGFLQNSTVILDLCCAPGGWLQVAAKTVSPSAVLIGIDLAPMKPLPNVEFFQEDITTEKCYHLIKKFLKSCKLDCVLHDGAPNLGNNWLYDAHSQVRLTFYAFKLAIQFLAPGGVFVTKLFRSKDYNSLLWLFRKFFKKVEATKPLASRSESAEMYIICQGFIRYDKIDARYLDPKFIFQETDEIPTAKDAKLAERQISLSNIKDGTHNDMDISLNVENEENDANSLPVQYLSDLTDEIGDKRDTSDTAKVQSLSNLKAMYALQVQECKEIASMQHRLACEREKMMQHNSAIIGHQQDITTISSTTKTLKQSSTTSYNNTDPELTATKFYRTLISDLDFILAPCHKKLLTKDEPKLKEICLVDPRIRNHALTTSEIKALCRDLKVINTGDMRSLIRWATKIKRVLFAPKEKKGEKDRNEDKDLTEEERLEKQILAIKKESEHLIKVKRRKVAKMKSKLLERMKLEMDTPHDITDSMENEELFSLKQYEGFIDNDDVDDEENRKKSLIKPLGDHNEREAIRMEQWFDRPTFKLLDFDALENMASADNHPKISATETNTNNVDLQSDYTDDEGIGSSDNDSNNDADTAKSGESLELNRNKKVKTSKRKKGDKNEQNENINNEKLQLDTPEEMLLAAYMMQSKKKKNLVEDESYHRYTFGESASELPDWFVEDERKYNTRKTHFPILNGESNSVNPKHHLPPEYVDEVYQKYQRKNINCRPIKKVLEAKARKKRRAVKRMAKVIDRAQKLTSSIDPFGSAEYSQRNDNNNNNPQANAMRDALEKKLIAKAKKGALKNLSAKRDKIYMVAKGKSGGNNMAPSKGKKMPRNAKVVKVDRRMKKDNMRRKLFSKSKKGAKRKHRRR